LAERAKIYLLGIPDKEGEVSPPRINMENKLDKLETKREFLLEMCLKDKRHTHNTGKEGVPWSVFFCARCPRNMTKRSSL
jgi:hypothetical protein